MKNTSLHLPVLKYDAVRAKATLLQQFAAALTVLSPAFLFSLKSDMPHIFIIAFLILAAGLFLKKPLPPTDRPVIYCIVGAMVLTALPDLMVSMDEARYGLFDILIRTTLILPFLVYLAAFGGLFPVSARITGARAALSIGAMLLCGDRFSTRNLSNDLLSFMVPLLREYYTVYIVCAAVQAVSLPLFFLSTFRKNEGKPGADARKRRIMRIKCAVLRSVCILLLPVCAAASFVFYRQNGAILRSIEFYFMRLGVQSRFRADLARRRAEISRQVDLRMPPPDIFSHDSEMILFRAKAAFPPGLLRSGVYEKYENGRWYPPERSEKALDVTRRTEILSFNTFRLTLPYAEEIKNGPDEGFDREKNLPGEKDTNKVELYFEALRTPGIIPVPGNTLRVDAVADSAEITPEGVLTLKHWKRDGGCTIFVRTPEQDSAYPLPEDNAYLKRLLAHPEPFRSIAETILRKNTVPGKILSSREKVQIIAGFLLHRYQYSLHVSRRGGPRGLRDPVLRFLLHTRAGHCEFFASAAVLLLRAAGLPARYVTGFACEEKSVYGSYYIVRNAHAWCEVFLPEEKKWIAVDPTPPVPLPAFRSGPKFQVKSLLDFLQQSWRETFAAVRRGYFADAVLSLLTALWHCFKFLLAGWGACVFYPLLLIFATRFLLKKRHKSGNERTAVPARLAWSAELRRFEKEYARLTRSGRPEEIPLRKWYAAVSPELEELIVFYENFRYGPRLPEKTDIILFRRKKEKVLASLRESMRKKRPFQQ